MNKKLVFFSFMIVTQVYNLCAWSTDYRVINTINKEIQVRLTSVGRDVGNFKLKPGEVKTVTTNLANCIDMVFVDGTYRGGSVCAGSVVCITDEGGYYHVLAKPYYGQLSKELPCTAEKLGLTAGASSAGVVASAGAAGAATFAATGATADLAAAASISATAAELAATVSASTALGASEAAVLGAQAATGAAIGASMAAEAGAALGAAAAVPLVAIPAAVIAIGALVGCGAADLAVMSGLAKGSAGTFSAEDWQDPESTVESRAEKKRKAEEQARLALKGIKAMQEQDAKRKARSDQAAQAMQDQDAKREKARQAALAAFQKG